MKIEANDKGYLLSREGVISLGFNNRHEEVMEEEQTVLCRCSNLHDVHHVPAASAQSKVRRNIIGGTARNRVEQGGLLNIATFVRYVIFL